MALNFPGPYQLRMVYTTTPTGFQPLLHTARYNIDLTAAPTPGTDFSLLTIKIRNGVPNEVLSNYCDAWVALVRPILSSFANNTIDYFELWEYAPGTFDAQFISVYPVNLAGTTASAAAASHQDIITFRTLEGGIMKLSFMETIFAAVATDTPPFLNANVQAIADFVVSGLNGFLGADTSYPFATRAWFPGSNEALFRKRYRP